MQVALLEHRDDGVGRQVAVDDQHGLMLMRVELLARRVDLADLRARERGVERLQREVDAVLQGFDRYGRIGRNGLLERVLHCKQVFGEFFDGVLVCTRDIRLALAPDVFGFGAGTQPRVLHFRRLGKRLVERIVVRRGLPGGARLGGGGQRFVEGGGRRDGDRKRSSVFAGESHDGSWRRWGRYAVSTSAAGASRQRQGGSG